MLNDISITAKTEINGETLIRLAEIQAEIRKSNTAALVGLANNGIQLLVVVQQARIAEAGTQQAHYEMEKAKYEMEKAKYEAEKAKYGAESAATDAAFRRASASSAKSKKPYTNGVAYNAE